MSITRRFFRVWWPEPYDPGRGLRRSRALFAGVVVSLTLSALALSNVLAFSTASTAAAVLPGIAWRQESAPLGMTSPQSIAVSSGGVYLAGYASGVWPATEGADAFVKKYDLNGNELWTRQFGSPEFDAVTAIAAHGNAVYLAGTTEGTLPGQTQAGSRDAFLRKYDANGEERWTVQLGTAAYDHASAIAVDDTGVYLAGTTEGSLPGQRNLGLRDAFLGKFDSQGNALWIKEFGSAGLDWTVGLGLDTTGVYVLSMVEDPVPPHARGVVVHKFDSQGNAIWVVRFGRPLNEAAVGIAAGAGGVYVASAIQDARPDARNARNSEGLLRKFDTQSNELWTRQFGAAPYLQWWSMAADATGVYVFRADRGSLRSPGEDPAQSGRRNFAYRFDGNGTALWTKAFTSSEFGLCLDAPPLIASDAAGLYVAYGAGNYRVFRLSPLAQASLFDEWSPRLPFVGVAAASMLTLVALKRRGKKQPEPG